MDPSVVPIESNARQEDSGSPDVQRVRWQDSPDTEEIRQHLLDLVRLPEIQVDEGYHFYTHSSHTAALLQLLEWRDERLLPALEDISQHPRMEDARPKIEETIRLFRERLGS